MDAEAEWICSICRDARDDVAYAMPCRHQFCLGCIARWVQRKPDCPLCRRQIETVRFSVQGEDDYLQLVATSPEESRDASNLAENSPHRPVASPPSSLQGMLSSAEQGAARSQATVGGLLPQVWAALFQRHPDLLHPVLPWLHQQLEDLYGAQWWQVDRAESSILYALCIYGPDEEVMVQVLRDCLQQYTAPLVHGLVTAITWECSEEAQMLLEEHDSPAASSTSTSSSSTSSTSTSSSSTSSRAGSPNSSLAASSSPAGSDEEDQPSTSEAALDGGPGHPPSAPVPAEQEQPQEEPGEVTVAGPSAQGCSCGPSAPGQGRDRLAGGRRRAPKRRAPGPQDSPQPCKRPPHRQH